MPTKKKKRRKKKAKKPPAADVAAAAASTPPQTPEASAKAATLKDMPLYYHCPGSKGEGGLPSDYAYNPGCIRTFPVIYELIKAQEGGAGFLIAPIVLLPVGLLLCFMTLVCALSASGNQPGAQHEQVGRLARQMLCMKAPPATHVPSNALPTAVATTVTAGAMPTATAMPIAAGAAKGWW